jgi:thiosulfate/3-mercaptopyruvate sulfurtransferase
MFHAVFGTLIGHLNHANLDWDYGPLKYVFNNPKMHIWHHDYDGDTRTTVNFGIIFSTWDYLFGTAKVPDHPPAKLGFAGVETFPRDFFSQQAWPLPALVPDGSAKPAITAFAGLLVLGTGFVVAQPPSGPATPMLGEVAATSQPTTGVRFFDYAASVDEANERLDAFGATATAAGFARPEWMVSADELAGALGSDRLVLLDVRPLERFEEGHLPSAQPIDRPDYSHGDPAPGVSRPGGELEALLRARGVDDGDVVVAYGDGGPEPYRLWWTLRAMTGVEVRVLDGGMAAWMAGGHKLAAGAPRTVESGTVAVRAPLDRSPTLWDDVAPVVAQGAVLLDTRSAEEFTGDEHHKKAARAGRIPGAKHLDWWTVWRDGLVDQRLQEPDALRALAASYGIDAPTAPVVTMCQSGTRSATVVFALLQAGHDEAAATNYDGSWAEYSRLEELPVDVGPCTSC